MGLPLKEESVTGSPFSSGRVKSGAFWLISMTMYLYRKARQSVTLTTAIAIFSLALPAQFRAPLPERKTPRALAVLETFSNGSRRLVPVTFFYQRHYYDATFYHATPVPFTLYSETVYEVQQFGKTLGTFTVQSATQNEAAWFGNGRYRSAPDAATLAKKNAPRPIVLEDPSKPVLHRRSGSEGDNPVPRSAATTTAPEAENDPDRPKLHRREGSGGDSSASAPSQIQSASQSQQAGQASPSPKAGLTPSEDPEHPILRRGKPVRGRRRKRAWN